MKLKSGSYFLIVIIIVMLATIVAALQYPRLPTKLLPIVFAGTILLLAVIELIKETRATGEVDAVIVDEEGVREAAAEGMQGYLIHGGWLVGFVLGIFLLGFVISMTIFILTYMRFLGTRWYHAIISAIVVPGIIYGLFEILLQIKLYPGLLPTWLS